MDYVHWPTTFTREYIEAERIAQGLHDEVWIEREHTDFLASRGSSSTEQQTTRTVDGELTLVGRPDNVKTNTGRTLTTE